MAIKGKKKSGSRGSGGVRRPAQAPRPVATARKGPTPFYKTRDGRLIIGIFVVVALGTIIWAVMGARNEAKELEERADRLDNYTNQVRGALQPVLTPAGEMAATPTEPSEELNESLEKAVKGWKTNFSSAQTSAMAVLPSPEVEEIHTLVTQAITGYLSAADLYSLVPDADEKLQADLLERAAAQRDQSTGILEAVVSLLDDMRSEVDLSPSGLRAPEPQPAIQPTPAPSESAATGG